MLTQRLHHLVSDSQTMLKCCITPLPCSHLAISILCTVHGTYLLPLVTHLYTSIYLQLAQMRAREHKISGFAAAADGKCSCCS
jgi:hypothetical protein